MSHAAIAFCAFVHAGVYHKEIEQKVRGKPKTPVLVNLSESVVKGIYRSENVHMLDLIYMQESNKRSKSSSNNNCNQKKVCTYLKSMLVQCALFVIF